MSAKHMWMCAACVAVVAVAVLIGAGAAGVALGAVMCGAMMGAMVWMMIRGTRGSGEHRH